MKALVKAKPEPGIWMEDAALPAVGHNDVLVKINKTAICGTDVQAGDFHADLGDFADELMTHDHRHRDGGLRPFVPIVDMHVGAADGCLMDLNAHIVMAHGRLRHGLHPDAYFGFGFDQ